MKLRPYQLRAIDGVRAAFKRTKRVLLVMPTGGGKTATASVLITGSHAKGWPVLFLVHRREIVMDTVRRIRAAGVPCGVIMAGETRTDAPVQVASVQTVAARDAYPAARFIVWDEAHHTAAETYRSIAAQYPDAFHLGLTATPERSDRRGLRDAFDEMVIGAATGELCDLGVIAPVVVVGPAKRQSELSMEPLDAWRRHGEVRPTVAFLDSIESSKELAAAIGTGAVHLDGATSVRDRAEMLRAFNAGEVHTLCNVFVLTEGWDAPHVETIILGRGCTAAGTFLQIIGRGRRTDPHNPGKRCTLVDLCGAVHEHGMPDEDRTFSLDGIARDAEKKKLWIRQCAECGAVFEGARYPRTCPNGHELPPAKRKRVAAREVSTIDRTIPRSEMQRYFNHLSAMARARGWKPAAVGVRFKERFGFWPNGYTFTPTEEWKAS